MKRKGLVRFPEAGSQRTFAQATTLGATSLGALAAGAAAGGAVAIGALAIGALAIRSLAVKRAKIQRLSIDELDVRHLRVQSLIVEEERDEPHPFEYLKGEKYIRLTTYRKSGEPVATPVWFAFYDGRLHITTEPDSGKMKRVRNDPRVLISPCNIRGKPTGASVEGLGRDVQGISTGEAEQALRQKHWLGLGLFRLFGQSEIGKVILEIRPAVPEEESP